MTSQHRSARRRRLSAVLAAGAAMSLLATGPALASHADDWEAKPGTTVEEDGTIVLDTTGNDTPVGTSLENADLGVDLAVGDEISFDYELEGAVCGGGQPRLFVEVDGTYSNTFDGNESACGDDGMGATSGTVTYTYGGPDGEVGHAGIVFDNTSDTGVARITNVVIGDYELDLDHGNGNGGGDDPKDACKDGGWEDQGFRNQGQCIRFENTGKDSRE